MVLQAENPVQKGSFPGRGVPPPSVRDARPNPPISRQGNFPARNALKTINPEKNWLGFGSSSKGGARLETNLVARHQAAESASTP
jgi:hypothetical protein